MNIITRIKIEGFWGTRRLSVGLRPNINFFIGVNGTGKTTLINLIAATLNADFPTLDQLSFKKITIELKETRGKKRTSIEINKTPLENSPFSSINYLITDKTTGKTFDYSLDSYEEQLAFRYQPLRTLPSRYSRRKAPHPDLIEHLKMLLNVSWLSIHRSERPRTSSEERNYESAIDQKLDELSRDLAGHLSQMNRQSENQTAIFQQNAFLSLIREQKVTDLFPLTSTMNLESEQRALEDIFKLFQVEPSNYVPELNRHFKSVRQAIKQTESQRTIDSGSVIPLLTMLRIHLVVQEWNKIIARIDEIEEPKKTFLNTINGLLLKKKLQVNERNQFITVDASDHIFSLKQLSSGEKQLFIILGEALLQQKMPWIYIADEPELSLHVSWQSQLIYSLRNVNPNAQIIFATHSPDLDGLGAVPCGFSAAICRAADVLAAAAGICPAR